jgi:dipeptidase
MQAFKPFVLIASTCLCALLLLTAPKNARACTSILVTKGATQDGSTFITYAADSHDLYGSLVVTPARDHLSGSMREVFDWDTGKYLGQIEEVAHTYAVVGNMNEHQLAIAESTFGGRDELKDPTAIVDYGSLIYIALERAKTAKEAIKVMTDLVAKYGYASSGESFSISDANEAWILEMIAKGPANKGAVWVARRVPDGMISAHANQARIRQFSTGDASTLAAKDVITFARSKGYYTGNDAGFSFADAYNPMEYSALRFCEARVYSVFRRAAPGQKISSDYVEGKENAQPLPLWVKPDQKLSLHDTMELMRDHYEGTPLDMTKDVGAGAYKTPYRFRPLTFEVDGVTYGNERAISTQQTGFTLVAQSRSSLPAAIGGVLWFGVDDTYSTVYVPMYAGITSSPAPFDPATANFTRFSWDSAFWAFNAVSNLAYGRYSEMIVDIRKAQSDLEGSFIGVQADREKTALKLYQSSPEEARAYLTHVSHEAARGTLTRWRSLFTELLVKYLDGNVRDEHGKVTHPGYPADWYARIAKDAGPRLAVKKLKGEAKKEPLKVSGFFHSKDELGALASTVPADFPFATEKLFLVPGKDICARPPKCCVEPTASEDGKSLTLKLPKYEKEACGPQSWLVRLKKDEHRPVY